MSKLRILLNNMPHINHNLLHSCFSNLVHPRMESKNSLMLLSIEALLCLGKLSAKVHSHHRWAHLDECRPMMLGLAWYWAMEYSNQKWYLVHDRILIYADSIFQRRMLFLLQIRSNIGAGHTWCCIIMVYRRRRQEFRFRSFWPRRIVRDRSGYRLRGCHD